MKTQFRICLILFFLTFFSINGFANKCADLKAWVLSQVPGGSLEVNLVDSGTYSFTVKDTETANAGMYSAYLYINNNYSGRYGHGDTVNLTLIPGQTIDVKLRYNVYLWHRFWPHTCENSWDTRTIRITYQPEVDANDFYLELDPVTCGNDQNLILKSEYPYYTDQIEDIEWNIADNFDVYESSRLTARIVPTALYNAGGSNPTAYSATVTLIDRTEQLLVSDFSLNIVVDNSSTVQFAKLAVTPEERVYSNITVVEFDRDDTTDDQLFFSDNSRIARYTWNGSGWEMKILETPGQIGWRWTAEQNNILAVERDGNVWVYYIDNNHKIRYAIYNQEGDLEGSQIVSTGDEVIDRLTIGSNNGVHYVVGYDKVSRYVYPYTENTDGSYTQGTRRYWINTGTGLVTVGDEDESRIILVKSGRLYVYEVTPTELLYHGYKQSTTGTKFYAKVTSANIEGSEYMVYFQDSSRRIKMFTYDISNNSFGALQDIELAYEDGPETVVNCFEVDKNNGDLYYLVDENDRLYSSRNIADQGESFEYRSQSHYLINKLNGGDSTSNGIQFTFANSHLYFLERDSNDYYILFNTWYDEGCTPTGAEQRMANATTKSQIQEDVEIEEIVSKTIPKQTPLRLSPNPASDMLEISFGLEQATDVSVGIYSITGKLVGQYEYTQLEGVAHSKRIDVSDFNRGMYILIVKTTEWTKTKKLMIK